MTDSTSATPSPDADGRAWSFARLALAGVLVVALGAAGGAALAVTGDSGSSSGPGGRGGPGGTGGQPGRLAPQVPGQQVPGPG